MRFKILLITTAISLAGCGLLGPKNKPAEKSDVGATGCLDNSKDLVGRYVSGELSQAEWKEAFGCINESLNFFTEYVRGSYEDAYSQGDMYTLISRFLIKNRPVNRELMRGAFNLKRALFGGDASKFTNEQVDLMQTSLDRLQAITGDLIPYLKLRQDPNATYDEMLELADAFKRAGDQLADFVRTLPVGDLSDQALKILIDQLTETLELNLVEGLDRKVFLSKWLMFNTRRDAFVASDWPRFFKTAMSVGGIALSFKTAETKVINKNSSIGDSLLNDYRYREFLWKLALAAKPIVTESLTSHEGNTPFPIFDHLIDEIPDSYLKSIPRSEVKDFLRPLVRKLLMSKTKTGVDANVVETIYGFLDNIVQDLGLIDRFYEATSLDREEVQPSVLKISLGQFESSLTGSDLSRFKEIKTNILLYKPMFFRDTTSIMHQTGVGYAKNQIVLTTALNRLVKHVHATYGSGDQFFTEDDFRGILEEPAYKAILNSLTWVDATVPRFYAKRFQDMDLFTPVSNGDAKVSFQEMINYAMMIVSSGNLTTKMRNEITPRCDQNLGQDLMGWTWIPIQCFRNEFFKNFEYWLTYFPRLNAYWKTLTPEQKAKAAIWLEHGGRRNGYGESYTESDWVGKYDFGSMAAVMHYTESMFTRFDDDLSEVLSKNELGDAYPVFKNLIYKKAKISNKDYVLKGIFTYIVKYRQMPVTNSAAGLGKLAWWLASYTLQNYTADRLGIFNIVCQLAAPENTRPNPNDPSQQEDPEATNARICQ